VIIVLAAPIQLIKKNVKIEMFEEGTGPIEFWQFLGGKSKFYQEAPPDGSKYPIRLFHCNYASGIFNIEEELDFCQDDLADTDVNILDTYYCVFLWFGKKTSDFVKKNGNANGNRVFESNENETW